MKQVVTRGIILSRTNYGEADRIITVLTPDEGKLRLLAKGVRRIKSKMAGGIELFSENDITFIRGRGELGTLVSSRLRQNFGSSIVSDIDRSMYAFEVLKLVNKMTEDEPEEEYFNLLLDCLKALNSGIKIDTIAVWFNLSILKLSGHMPNLESDIAGNKLAPDKTYLFSFDDMSFADNPNGPYTANYIKLLRLSAGAKPDKLANVQGAGDLAAGLAKLTGQMLKTYTN